MSRDSRERTLTSKLAEALASSLHLSEVFSNAEDVLFQLLPADYMALCISRPDRPGDYDWWVTQMPAPFLARYSELSEDDFVRSAVVRRPNVVLRDAEMVPQRQVLERSRWYRYCRELGMPLEHVMSVLLDMSGGVHGGLTFYRERRRPFSKREQVRLQGVTSLLTHTVRNCRMYGEVAARGQVLDAFFHQRGARCLVQARPFVEKMRTPSTTTLLRKWFSPSELGPSGLPKVLVARMAVLAATEGRSGPGWSVWEQAGKDRDLRVTCTRLPERDGQRLWALEFQEVPHVIPLPEEWRRKVSEREAEVVGCVLKGWDNQLIAAHLGLAVGTVKKHLQNVFDKLGMDTRAALISQAARKYQEPLS